MYDITSCKRTFTLTKLVVFLVLLILVIIQLSLTSPVWHEPSQLLSGLNIWHFQRFDTQEVNPPLVRSVVTLPVLVLSPQLEQKKFDRQPIGREEFAMAGTFLTENGSRVKTFFIAARMTCLLFLAIGIYICSWFSKHAFGHLSGFLAILLICTSPYILGHGTTILPDVPSAALAITSIYFFWKWLKRPDMLEAFIAGMVLGLAELTKFTLLIFYPLFILLWLLYKSPEFRTFTKNDWFQQAKQMTVMLAISILIINMGYLFDGTGKQLGTFKFQTTLLTGCEKLGDVHRSGGNRFEGRLLGCIPMPLPSNYIQGIDTQRLDFERGLPSYLRGEWSDHGWWYYYLYALLMKTPLGTIGLLLLAIFCTFFQKGYNTSWRDEMVILLPGIVLLVFVSSQTGFSIHSRYIIPALPFFFIWMSKVGKALTLKRPIVATLTAILLTWSVASSLWVYPHSISYFNELAAVLPTPEDTNYPKPVETQKTFWQKTKSVLNAGPMNGPRHLLDSNIDWGQDLFNLERLCKAHPEVTDIKVAYYGSYPLELSKVPSTGMPPANDPQPGWYALSVNYIYDRSQQYRYFLNYEPVATAGYSIYIYHITPDEANRVRREMGLSEIEAKPLNEDNFSSDLQ